MKQVFRRVIDRRGRVVVLDLPEPHVGADQVLVHSRYSLISSGTEMTTLSKTPTELVKQTLSDPWMRNVVKQTVFAAGMSQTARRVWHEMITPREIGYSGAGTVLALGERCRGHQGRPDRRLRRHRPRRGGGADHQPRRARARTPSTSATPSFVTVGGIAIQALRRAELQFGEVVAIYGLGLVGQLCARIALAAGCVVVGIDINPRRTSWPARPGVSLVVDPQRSRVEAAAPRLHRQARRRRHHRLRLLRLIRDHQRFDGDHPPPGPGRAGGLRQARHPPEALPVPRDRPPVLARLRPRELSHRLREGSAGLPLRLRALDREAATWPSSSGCWPPARSTSNR